MPGQLQPPGLYGSAAGTTTLAVGQRVSHYQVLEKLGEGGFGQVFLAHDLRLGRQVALKTLPPEFLADGARVRRFKQEAHAIAALNHPNIVTLFAEESVEGVQFLAMEYIEGKTLAELLPRGGFDLERFFALAVPLADAISAAHERGVTHRDLKPQNVMCGADCRIKVLDFGLARQVDPVYDSGGSSVTEEATAEGFLVGTMRYMSPEQMRGEPLDERSDIFSLGVVLYEMVNGTVPFRGETPADLISSVMRDRPARLSKRRRDIPHHLERIVERCLEKNPDYRYQSAQDLRNDLGFLQRELRELEGKGSSTRIAGGRRDGRELLRQAAGVAVGVILALGAWLLFGRSEPGIPQGQPRQVTAGVGWEAEVAISPDGRTLAYASDESGNEDIWTVDAEGGGSLRLTEHPASDRSPAWFPDGSAIAFQSEREGKEAIFKVPRLGGSPTVLIADALDPAISPDGRRIAFAFRTPTAETRIGVARLADPSEMTLLTGPGDGLWNQRYPAWSPDSEQIAYSDANDLWLVAAGGGVARRLTRDAAGDEEPAWSSDGRFVFFSSYREGTLAIWRIKAEGGEPQRVTGGTGPERHPSVSRDGTHLAYTTFVNDLSLELVDLASGERRRFKNGRSDWGATVAPDRSAIVYASNLSGFFNLWRQALDGLDAVGSPFRLIDEVVDSSNPDFAPDGAWIAYHRRAENGDRNIWVVAADGGVPRPLTREAGVRVHPAWSPDGTHIAFVSDLDDRSELWVMPVDDGAPAGPARELPAGAGNLFFPNWSPDGRWVAYLGATEGTLEVWVTPADGTEAPRRLTEDADAGCLRWNPVTGKLLVTGHWGAESISLRALDPETGATELVELGIEFEPGEHGLFDLSPDGRLLVVTREEVRGDLWTLKGRQGTY